MLPVLATATEIDTQYYKANIANCADIKNDGRRLSCFDKAIGNTNSYLVSSNTRRSGTSDTSEWQISSSKDAMTDEKNVYLVLQSDTHKKFGRNSKLIVRCLRNKTEMYIDWPGIFNFSFMDDNARIRTRIDLEQPLIKTWHFSKRPIRHISSARNNQFFKIYVWRL